MKTFRIAQLNANYYNQSERLQILVDAIAHSQADFVTLQEVVDLDLLLDLLKLKGYKYSVFSALRNNRGALEYVGIVGKYPLEAIKVGEALNVASDRICLAKGLIGELELNLFSAHFFWGGDTELQRTKQAELVDQWAAEAETLNPNSISILGGDLNAEPDYRSIRYLLGKELSLDQTGNTLWTDAWVSAGSKENEFTNSHSTNQQGRATAFRSGIGYPGFLPDRRIDYILARGWRYGRIGSPVSFGYMKHPEGLEISDHNGIYADLLLSFS